MYAEKLERLERNCKVTIVVSNTIHKLIRIRDEADEKGKERYAYWGVINPGSWRLSNTSFGSRERRGYNGVRCL